MARQMQISSAAFACGLLVACGAETQPAKSGPSAGGVTAARNTSAGNGGDDHNGGGGDGNAQPPPEAYGE